MFLLVKIKRSYPQLFEKELKKIIKIPERKIEK